MSCRCLCVRVPEACPCTSVVLVYRAWDCEKCEVLDVAHARALPGGAELEVVMQNPGWRRR